MADKKSKDNPYQWPSGGWHSIPWAQEQGNLQAKAVLGGWTPGSTFQDAVARAAPYGPPPVSNNSGQPVDAAGNTLPAPMEPTAQPVDPSVLNAQLIGNRNFAIGKGQAAYDTGNLGFDYGYNTDGTVNTANPYSRAALLQLGYEDSRRGTTNSLAAQGQLYSGAMLNAQGRNDSNYAQSEAANRLGYQRGLHGIQTGQLNTAANAGTGVSDSDFAALLRATYPGS